MVKLSFVVLSLVLAEYISTWRLNSPATNFSTGFCLHDVAFRLTLDLIQRLTLAFAIFGGFTLHLNLSAVPLSPLLVTVVWPLCSCDCPYYSTFFPYHNLDLTNMFEALSTSNGPVGQTPTKSPWLPDPLVLTTAQVMDREIFVSYFDYSI